METLIYKLEFLLAQGISMKTMREGSQFKIELKYENCDPSLASELIPYEQVVLPFDHLNETKVVRYISLMEKSIQEKILKLKV